MTKNILIGVIVILSASYVLALSPCRSGDLTTVVNKEYQVTYSEEDFLQVNNMDLVKDVSQLKDLTCLQYIDATDRTIKGDIVNLKNLKNLEVFSFYSNPEVFGDICVLAGAVKLRSLKFAFDPQITGDVSCLKDLTKLETFAMTHTQISGDISVFANMLHLKAIYISGTNIQGDICALSKLTSLQELGIADEYPGNPGITGDLSCLRDLKKLTRVSLYNTKATNCEQFTQDHPNIEQGGCSKESMKTVVDYAQKYEKKIGKEIQTEVKGQPDYQPAGVVLASEELDNRGFFAKLFDWIKNLFKGSPKGNGITDQSKKSEDMNKIRPTAGPEGCKTQVECDVVCSKTENKEVCSTFAPSASAKEGKGESDVRPNLETGELGGCKTRAECEEYCSNPENKEVCSTFAPRGEETRPSVQQNGPPRDVVKVSKLVCRVSVLPSSKGDVPYQARVCVDNPDERIQQEYKDYVDFEGDGSWNEYENAKHGCHSYTYQTKGTFSPTAKIVDIKGIESDICQTTLTVS
ncbi:hypothetical protein HYX11_04655 [Candidatus Woesearchaeota archaeon]|nr:hypothetical protein [Candidatus Woesearchaeota archaeon]